MSEPEGIAQQAKLVTSHGANCASVTDSAGAMDIADYGARCETYDRVPRPETQRGIHARPDLSFGVAGFIVGVQSGAVGVDARLAENASVDNGVGARKIRVETGRRPKVGGQADMIGDVAPDMAGGTAA